MLIQIDIDTLIGNFPVEVVASDVLDKSASIRFSIIVSRFPILTANPLHTAAGATLLTISLLGGAWASYQYRNQLASRLSQSVKKLRSPALQKLSLFTEQELVLGAKLGAGAFGTVYAGKCGTMDVAVKLFDFDHGSSNVVKSFTAEIEVMASLTHPKVVTIYGIRMGRDGEIGLVMKLIKGGSLFDYLHKENTISRGLFASIVLDIAYGLHYLHSQSPEILHRDIKSANVLLEKDHHNKFHARLIDFGLAEVKAELAKKNEAAGTLPWMAPELFVGKSYTKASDVYSFGMVLWELVTRKIPYSKELSHVSGFAAFKKLKSEGKTETIPKGTPEELASIIRECWSLNPSVRPTLNNIIERLETYKAKLDSEQKMEKVVGSGKVRGDVNPGRSRPAVFSQAGNDVRTPVPIDDASAVYRYNLHSYGLDAE